MGSTGDEWWRHDDADALDTRHRQASSGSNGASSTKSSSTERSGYSLDDDVVAPWRQNDRTSHLDAMRTKRNSRARKQGSQQSQRNQFATTPAKGAAQAVPQFKDKTARNGGWNIPALNADKNGNATNGGILGRFDKQQLVFAGAILLALILVIFILRGIIGCVSAAFTPQVEPETEAAAATTEVAQAVTNGSGSIDSVSYTVLDENRTTASGMGRMSFSAVGDNLMNSNLLELADSWSGETGDGAYDFSPFYTEIASYIQNWVDVSFINQETTLGGTDNFNYEGYPSYNTPDSLADAVSNAGWRIVNLNTNHTYDTWTASIEHAQSVWAQKTNLITVGSYASEQDRQTLRLVECNGVRLAVLSYSYGQNGYEQSDLPNTYYAVPYDEETLKADVANARKVADAVIVYMHEGTEYTNEPNDTQRAIAQVCADNGVDVVIGSHAHVIQPVEWVDRADGSGQMLCVYGLGDFVSGYTEYPDVVLSGMITFDLVKNVQESSEGDGSAEATTEDSSATSVMATDGAYSAGVTVENVVWHPLIEHMSGGSDTVRFVKNYTDEEARANELLTTLDDPLEWLKNKTKEVIGDTVTIDL